MAATPRLTLLLLGFLALHATNGAEDGEQTEGHDWGYYGENVGEDEGPDQWKDHFPTCGLKQQSPVHIYKEDVLYDKALEQDELKYDGYDEQPAANFTMSNNGHTLVFAVNSEHYISGGGLGGKFQLVQFHLHWGSGNNNGSEHWVDDRHYAAELHLVHYNTKYADINEAVDKEDGLAVLGSIIAVEGEDNEYMADIVRHLTDVAYADSPAVDVMAFPIIQMLPRDHAVFYRYPGSLTTPPCHESVTWTVFENHISISQAQINKLRTELHHSVEAETGTSEDYKLMDNHRPPQELHGRVIRTNVAGDGDDTSTAAHVLAATSLVMGAALLNML